MHTSGVSCMEKLGHRFRRSECWSGACKRWIFPPDETDNDTHSRRGTQASYHGTMMKRKQGLVGDPLVTRCDTNSQVTAGWRGAWAIWLYSNVRCNAAKGAAPILLFWGWAHLPGLAQLSESKMNNDHDLAFRARVSRGTRQRGREGAHQVEGLYKTCFVGRADYL